MINITTSPVTKDWRASQEPLFSIDGTEYGIPVEVPTNVGLKALRKVAELGETAGTHWLMVFVLGQDAWDALEGCQELTRADLEAIQKIVRTKVFGDLEDQGKG